MTVPDNVRSGERATSAWANQLLAVVRDLDAHNDVVSIARSGAQLIVTQRDGTVTQLDLPEDELPEYPSGESGIKVLFTRSDGLIYWGDNLDVPISGRENEVLTKIGTNDTDYAFRHIRQALALAAGGGLEFGSDGELRTTPSLVGTANTQEQVIRRVEALESGGGGGGGQTEAQVDARVRALVTDWAEQGNTDRIPEGKISTDIARDSELQQAIADLSENEVRVVAVSGWDAHDNARTLHIAIYPPEAIGRNQTLRFTVGGIAATASSGDGIDANGGVVELTINATNSAAITRSAARDGHVAVDWIHAGNIYHGYVDYVPPVTIPAPQSRILLAATLATTEDTVTLPTSYTNFKWFTIVGVNSACLLNTSPSPRDS